MAGADEKHAQDRGYGRDRGYVPSPVVIGPVNAQGLARSHPVMAGTAAAVISFTGLVAGAVLVLPGTAFAGAVATTNLIAQPPTAQPSTAQPPSDQAPGVQSVSSPETWRAIFALYSGDAVTSGHEVNLDDSGGTGAFQSICAAAQRDAQPSRARVLTAAYARGETARATLQYSQMATSTDGPLGVFLRTVENMRPALKATSGEFSQQTAALDAAYAEMVRAAKRPGDAASVEQQGLHAIQEANEAINAQGKTEEYTDNLLRTGAGERQWGTAQPGRPYSDAVRSGTGTPQRVAFSADDPGTADSTTLCR